jgi:regulator of sigma E protease
MFLTIITFLVVLSLLVFVHEFGHFWTARKLGLKPREFGFGFKPRAIGIYKSTDGTWKKVKGSREVKDAADTIYSLNWLPLGGFVELGEDEEAGDDPNHFSKKKPWERSVILLAGVTMNMILAFVLISVGYMIGLPQVIDDLGSEANILSRQIQVVSVSENSPAENAGLSVGDVILNVDGSSLENTEFLEKYANENVDQELNYFIERGGEQFEQKITPIMREETGKGGIGIGIIETGIVKYPFFTSIWKGAVTTVDLTGAILGAFYGLLKNIFSGQGVGADVAGPVGIAVLTGQVARMGFVYILQFAAMLSINLAIINVLPFPALDGGRVLFIIIEKIKGSPVKREVEGMFHYIGFALLMLLVLVVTFKDVARYGDAFKGLIEKIIN